MNAIYVVVGINPDGSYIYAVASGSADSNGLVTLASAS